MKNHYPVFVYGTLRKGFHNHMLLQGKTEKCLLGKMKGELYVSPYSTFPSMIEGDSDVIGEVYWIKEKNYGRVMNNLDYLEGYDKTDEKHSMYIRRLKDVVLESGEKIKAWVYIWNMNELGERIESGDWKEYRMNGGNNKWATLWG